MARSCDHSICQLEATRIGTYEAERKEMKTKAACTLIHQHALHQQLTDQGFTVAWKMLPAAATPEAQP